MKFKNSARSNKSGSDQLTTGTLFDQLSAVIMCNRANDCQVEVEHDVADTIGTFNLSSLTSPVVLDHQNFDGTRGWRTSESKNQPSVELMLSSTKADYDRLHIS